MDYGEFKVNGILKWNLFGVNIYSEARTYTGLIE